VGLFRRKAPDTVPSIELPILDANGLTLQQKLRLEMRVCGTCGYEISNPMTDRCPRCFNTVPLSEHTNCGDCTHQGNCAFQQFEK
jgi:hypothetical protein